MSMAEQTKKISLALFLGLIAFGAMIAFFTLQQSLMVAAIVLMVTLWTNEGLPLAVVSLLPIVLFPAFGVLSTKEAAVNYANPIIYLFLGGFMIAIAVENAKSRVLKVPLTFSLPFSVRHLNSRTVASTLGLIFRRSLGML